MPYYTAKAGDTLIALAASNGLKDFSTILDAPQNASLKEKRKDPGILFAGDVVFIPARELLNHPSGTDNKHTFQVSRPKAWVRMAVKDAAGKALANLKYELNVEGTKWTGTLPADGVVEQGVPPSARSGRLTVWLDATTTEIWELNIGAMDPNDEISGIQARLNNLGFDCGDVNGEMNDATKTAIRAFQSRLGVDVTGEVDDTLKQKLMSYYDPSQDETSQEASA